MYEYDGFHVIKFELWWNYVFIMSWILADNFFVKANDGFAKLRCGVCICLQQRKKDRQFNCIAFAQQFIVNNFFSSVL